jgi:hypothetical protein
MTDKNKNNQNKNNNQIFMKLPNSKKSDEVTNTFEILDGVVPGKLTYKNNDLGTT